MNRLKWIPLVLGVVAIAVVFVRCDRGDSTKTSVPATTASDDEGNSLGATDPILHAGDEAKPAPLASSIPNLVATVNGTKITRAEFMDAVVSRFEVEVHARQTLICTKALKHCLEKRNLEVSGAEIDKETKQILDKEGKSLEQFLAERKFTNDYLRQQVYYRCGIKKLAFAAGFSAALDDLTAKANSQADRLLFEENLIKWRWMGIPDSAWVTVNGEEVSLDEAYRWSVTWKNLWDVMKILNELVAWELERQAIRDAKVEIPKNEFDQLMDGHRMAAQQAGMTLDQLAQFNGVSVATLEDRVRRALGLRILLRFAATDDRLLAALEAQGPDKGGYGPAVHVAEIVVQAGNGPTPSAQEWAEANAKIQEAIVRLKNGELFADVSRSISTDPNLRSRGGDLGWITTATPSLGEIASRASELETNAVSDPIVLNNAIHVIRVVGKRSGATAKEFLNDPANHKKAVDDFVRDEKKPWHLRMKREAKLEIFLGR
ncbi:MAG: peptidylprolyl isomerase [Planctomycetes bacterium]|nr:peptidylprolyl isomerase [Planctomycetota bacterium]MBI3847498.1 peptidylprolyl isomerase [Planctomycetota bacterium]